MTILTDRFTRAVDYARIAHAAQVRKGTTIPYITHLLAVATLVIEYGGSEDQAIAGLLHDTIEDCGHSNGVRVHFSVDVEDRGGEHRGLRRPCGVPESGTGTCAGLSSAPAPGGSRYPTAMSTPFPSQRQLQNHRQAIVFHRAGLREDGAVVPLPSSQLEYLDVAA